MRVFILFALSVSAFAQGPVQNIDVAQILANRIAPGSEADRVVAVVDGSKVTAAELYRYYKTLSSSLQYYLAQNRKELLERYITARKVLSEAEANKLDAKEPYKTRLIDSREQILTQARFDEIAVSKSFSDQDKQKHYNEHLDSFTFGVARGILVATIPNKPEETKKRADDIVKRIRDGELFEKVAKETSADRQTGNQGGLLGLVAKVGPLPEEFRKAIFSLKPGQVGDPIEFRGSLWIFGLDKIQIKSYDDVKDDVLERLKQDLVEQHMQSIRRGLTIKVEDEEYFKKPDVPQEITVGDAASPAPKK
jgi:parvulin-like peptidyl-prolyl isomerase